MTWDTRLILITVKNSTKNTSDGTGVYVSILIYDNKAGICPFLAPTKHILELAIIWTHKPPNADIATINGMTHAPYVSNLFPNVCISIKRNQIGKFYNHVIIALELHIQRTIHKITNWDAEN